MGRSLKVHTHQIPRVKAAVQVRFVTQQRLAEELNLARSTVSNFLNGKPVDYINFTEICDRLALDIKDIAILDDNSSIAIENNNPNTVSQSGVEQTDVYQLHKALLSLNYTKQENLFKEFIEINQIGACLISGQPDYGQKWLLNRLLQLVTGGNKEKIVYKFSLLAATRSSSIKALWRRLAGDLGVNSAQPEEIAKAICHLWKSQTIIVIFEDLDFFSEDYLQEFIADFWQPLVSIAGQSPAQLLNYRLLAFLIDSAGCIDDWSITCVEKIDDNWQPHTLIKLPKITQISQKELTYWLDISSKDLPKKLTLEPDKVGVNIWEKSEEGKPQSVLEYICELCDCNWYQWEKLWLKH